MLAHRYSEIPYCRNAVELHPWGANERRWYDSEPSGADQHNLIILINQRTMSNADAAPQMQAYTKSLLDPFDKTISQPKLLDGKVARLSGIRLQATGEITCAGTGTTYVALFPGASNVIAWKVDEAAGPITPHAFAGHLDSVNDRSNVKSCRTVGTALRLSLVNSADQNEGYWEAARVPTNHLDFSFSGSHVGEGTTSLTVSLPMGGTGNVDLSNYATYLTGKLRDIHRFQFKLSAIDNNIKFW
jgi:hypothetical protein